MHALCIYIIVIIIIIGLVIIVVVIIIIADILIGTILVTVSATDADGRDNSITYSFAPDNDTALFIINNKTGDISLGSSFPALSPSQAVSVI